MLELKLYLSNDFEKRIRKTGTYEKRKRIQKTGKSENKMEKNEIEKTKTGKSGKRKTEIGNTKSRPKNEKRNRKATENEIGIETTFGVPKIKKNGESVFSEERERDTKN